MGDEAADSFDFEAIDGDSDQLSVLVTATPSSSVVGDDDSSPSAMLVDKNADDVDLQTLQTAHTSLSGLCPRFITVLSDFGETEKFVLEGDSLLQHALEDERLDWSNGGQFLHLTYVVEKFLSELLKRGGHFCIPFFHSHARIWADASTRVFRALLIHHLKVSLAGTVPVVCFDSPASEEWHDFLQSFQPALVAVSDVIREGAPTPFPLRTFSISCLTAGIHLLLMRDMEILDHSIQGFYLSGRQLSSVEAAFAACSPLETVSEDGSGDDDVKAFLSDAAAADAIKTLEGRSWHVLAAAWGCAQHLKHVGCTPATTAAVKLVLIHSVLLARQTLPLYARAQALTGVPAPSVALGEAAAAALAAVMQRLDGSLFVGAEGLGGQGLAGCVVARESVCDFADGRLLRAVAGVALASGSAGAEAVGLDEAGKKDVEAAWRCVCGAAGCSGEAFPVEASACDGEKLQAAPQEGVGALEGGLAGLPSGSALLAGLEEVGAAVAGTDGGEARAAGECVDAALGGSATVEGWQVDKGLDSFLWAHCRDQSASADSGGSRSMSEWERRKALRWKARQSQMYFRHLHEYAASLAGSTVLGASTGVAANAGSEGGKEEAEGDAKEEQGGKGGKGGKGGGKAGGGKGGGGKGGGKGGAPKLSKKEQMLADIEAKKQKGAAQKLEGEWKELQDALKQSSNAVAKVTKGRGAQIKDLDDFCRRCTTAQQPKLAMQVTVRRLQECKSAWAEDRQGHGTNMKFAIMSVEIVRALLSVHLEPLRDPKSSDASEARIEVVETLFQLGFVDVGNQVSKWLVDEKDAAARKELDEAVVDAKSLKNKLSVFSRSSPHFQLEHMGHLLPRPPPKVKDARITSFTPDDWQRELLDVVDQRHSALVCAPTSSGKTFISYYCMDKVMRDPVHKDGTMVFVAPTKALINQIAAQVYGAFHSSFGIYTDAYRHRALSCRILVTVPECLESLLLAPEHAAWAQRIRYVILDEVHCISTSEEGRMWERILLLANAPFLALSATVGEPETFVAWLQSVKDHQKAMDAGSLRESYEVKLVQHWERWVDLRRHVYREDDVDDDDITPEAMVKASRLQVRPRVDHSSSNVDGADKLETLHPLASLTRGQMTTATIPANLKFEPKDSLALWDAMQGVVRRAKEGDAVKERAERLSELDPLKFFTENFQFVSRPEAVGYEKETKAELVLWMRQPELRAAAVRALKALGNKIVDREERETDDDDDDAAGMARGAQQMVGKLFRLMGTLHRQDRLPAVVFNFDRGMCERVAFGFNEILSKAEEKAREEHSKTLKNTAKSAAQMEKFQKRMRDKVVSEKKEEERLQEMAEMGESNALEVTSMDEVTFNSQFTFVQEGRSSTQDFERITESARKVMGEAHPLIQILRRGVGVHHSGLQNKYRMAVEMLFRCGYLRVVISTETLAYGINMPCRSVVFAGDHVSLDSIQYQQMSGRAGRRGLDVLGHVVFCDIPTHKMHRLIVAPVPRLKGHFPLSPTTLLRMLSYLDLVPQQRGVSAALAKSLRSSALRPLCLPFFAAHNRTAARVLPAQSRVAVELLVRLGAVDAGGAPTPLATLADHLHAMDPCNLALLPLLTSGALHELCTPTEERNAAQVAEQLLALLALLFARHRLHPDRAADAALHARCKGAVVLPPISGRCLAVVQRYNELALSAAVSLAKAAAATAPAQRSVTLPLSQLEFAALPPELPKPGSLAQRLAEAAAGAEAAVCSPFSALSGAEERFKSVKELLGAGRPELVLHKSVVPVVEGLGWEAGRGGTVLSAYAVDFFGHEQLRLVCAECGIGNGEAWQGLRTLQLILASLKSAFSAMAPADDVVLKAVSNLEQDFSSKFYSRLYR